MSEATERERLEMALAGAEADVAHYRQQLGLPGQADEVEIADFDAASPWHITAKTMRQMARDALEQ